MKLPKYKITIDESYSDGEDLGIQQIAFTSRPAIKVKGMAFSSDIEKKKQFFADETKMRIVAPALIPMEIYRNDEDGEYYVEFTEQEIEIIHSKFMKNLTNSGKFNLEHNDKETVPSYILETWIVQEPLKDKAFSSFGIEVPEGTVMVISQLTDKNYYNSLVENGQTGYSIEGFLGLKLSELINKQKNKTNMKEKLFSKTERALFTVINEVNTYALEVDNTSFNVGEKITHTDKDGITLPISDGQYFLADGSSVFTDGFGTIVLVKPSEGGTTETPTESEVPAEPATPETPAPVAQTELAEVPVEPAPVAEAPKDETKIDEAAIMAILQPKLDEIYQMIADLKVEDTKEDMPMEPAETKMSITDKFSMIQKYIKD